MSKHSQQLTDNTSVKICSVSRGTDMDAYEATVFAVGGGGNDFGSGTVTNPSKPGRWND